MGLKKALSFNAWHDRNNPVKEVSAVYDRTWDDSAWDEWDAQMYELEQSRIAGPFTDVVVY